MHCELVFDTSIGLNVFFIGLLLMYIHKKKREVSHGGQFFHRLPFLPSSLTLHTQHLISGSGSLDLLTGRSSGLLLDDTLNVGDGLVENLLQDLGVFEFLVDLGDDALGQLALLALLDLSFVADPAVQHALRLGGEGGALLQLESLGFDLGGLLFRMLDILVYLIEI